MRRASCLEQLARFHTAKNGIATRYRLFALDRAIPRLFSISILIAGETKTARKSTRWSVWQPCFWGCDMTLRTPPAASKVHQNNETTKAKKDDTNILCAELGRTTFGSPKSIYISNPKTGIKQIEQFNMSPDSARKRKMRKMLFWNFWSFQFHRADKAFEIFEVFEGFQFTMQFTRWTAVLRFWGFQFNRADKVFEIFCPTGTRDTIILLEGVPSRWPPRVRPSFPRKLLEF